MKVLYSSDRADHCPECGCRLTLAEAEEGQFCQKCNDVAEPKMVTPKTEQEREQAEAFKRRRQLADEDELRHLEARVSGSAKAEPSSWRMPFSWKSFWWSSVIAIFLHAFTAAATGTTGHRNSWWTGCWIYLSIEAWKSWGWMALLPYPAYAIIALCFGGVFADERMTQVSIMAAINIGGLVLFYALLHRSQKQTTL